nr:immunoglobulin light chain junction region [Macaca mulatta]
GMQGIQFPLTF